LKKKGILIFVVLLLSISAMFLAKEMQKKLVSNEIASKTEAKTLQSDIKENSSEDSKNSDNGKIQAADNTNNSSEVKKEETKEASKTGQQNSSSKSTEVSKQSTEKAAAPKSSNTNTTVSPNASPNTNTTQNVNNSTATQNQSSSLPPNFIVSDEVSNKVICSTRVNFQGKSVADVTKDTLAKFNISYNYREGYFRAINGIKEQSLEPKTDGWCYYIKRDSISKKPSIGSADYIPQDNETILWKYVKDGTKP
jgi:cytoskeletal protein RodZ